MMDAQRKSILIPSYSGMIDKVDTDSLTLACSGVYEFLISLLFYEREVPDNATISRWA